MVGALSGLLGAWIRPIFGIGFIAAAWSSQSMAPQIGVDLLFDAIGSKRENVKLETGIAESFLLCEKYKQIKCALSNFFAYHVLSIKSNEAIARIDDSPI